MNNFIKSIIFFIIFIMIIFLASYLSLNKESVHKYGMYKPSLYQITNERENSIDVVAIGDSLVYSSVSPMDIWGETGITSYNGSGPAQTIPESLKHFEISIESQKPKLIFFEANVLFRNPKKKPLSQKLSTFFQNAIPIVKYHNNWKNLGYSKNNNIDFNKGFKYIKDLQKAKNFDYMSENLISGRIPKGNMAYFNKIVKLCKDNNVTLVLISNPSQTSWNNKKHNTTKRIAKEYALDFIDMNYQNPLKIDWRKDTRDKGSHLNYAGAKKASKFLADYLVATNLFESHKNDPAYDEWNRAYEKFTSND